MVVVVDYRAGNLYNVGNALKYLGAEFVFSSDPEVIARAERVILPGQGSARTAMDSLNERGLVEVLRGLKVPFLGICLGLQLLYEHSEEEDTPCLGILPSRVRRFDSSRVKVPQIGWNRVHFNPEGPEAGRSLFQGIPGGSYFYFAHSYYAPVRDRFTLGETDYCVRFASVAGRDNFWGLQFHPERSGQTGLRLLSNFLLK